MKKFFHYTITVIALISISFIFTSCGDDDTIVNNNSKKIVGSGNVKTESRTVGECYGIAISNIGNVYLSQDDNQSVIVEADDNVMEQVITREENGILKVGLKSGSYSNITLNLFISLKDIRDLSIEGTGKILNISEMTCSDLKCVINGAGEIHLLGSGNKIDCYINGSGKVEAERFFTKISNVILNGAGHCSVYAADEFTASLNGVGSIYYFGNPEYVKTSITGVGQIIRK